MSNIQPLRSGVLSRPDRLRSGGTQGVEKTTQCGATATRTWRVEMLKATAISAALLLTGCATKPQPLTLTIPESLRSPCAKPSPDEVQTVGALAAFSLRQDAALRICSNRGDALVAIIDGANQVVKPKRKKWLGVF